MTAALSDAHPALGALADGTPFFVPCGQVAVAGDAECGQPESWLRRRRGA